MVTEYTIQYWTDHPEELRDQIAKIRINIKSYIKRGLNTVGLESVLKSWEDMAKLIEERKRFVFR